MSRTGKHTKLQELTLRDEEEKARKLVTQTKQGRADTVDFSASPPRDAGGLSKTKRRKRLGPSFGAKQAVEGKAGSCKEEGQGLQAPPGSLWKLPGHLVMKESCVHFKRTLAAFLPTSLYVSNPKGPAPGQTLAPSVCRCQGSASLASSERR